EALSLHFSCEGGFIMFSKILLSLVTGLAMTQAHAATSTSNSAPPSSVNDVPPPANPSAIPSTHSTDVPPANPSAIPNANPFGNNAQPKVAPRSGQSETDTDHSSQGRSE